MAIGQIHAPDSLFLRTYVGKATAEDGVEYEMAIQPNGAPIVECKNTGKWFTLSWTNILNLAADAGIARPE